MRLRRSALVVLVALPLLVASPVNSLVARRCLGRNVTDHGTPGNDVLIGSPGSDVIKAGRGDDVVFGGEGQDFLCGNRGDDHLIGGVGNDTIDGGRGVDECEAEDERKCEA